MDKIKIKNLEVFCNHGVFPEENRLGQKFLVTAVLYTDTRAAGKSDDLQQSIHYGEVSHQIYEFMKNHTYKLLERAAEELAAHLLRGTAHLRKIRIEIKKPWAPIGLPLSYASVEIRRGWHTAYVAMGSNMGEKEDYIYDAVEKLKSHPDMRVLDVSTLIETEPYGYVEQDKFINGCMKIETLLTPGELLGALQKIEQEASRERLVRWGPRTLDLDIIFYDDCIISREDLTIPHKDMQNRTFVLVPLAEIAPWKIHPVYKKTIEELKGELVNESAGNEK